MKLKLNFFLFLFLLLLAAKAQAQQTQFWVNKDTGSDSNPCTQVSPCATIRHAAGLIGTAPGAGAGKTITVMNSATPYTENLDDQAGLWMPLGSGSSWANATVFTLKAQNRGQVTLQRNGILMRICGNTIGSAANYFSVIDGFVFDMSSMTNPDDPGIDLGCSENKPTNDPGHAPNFIRLQYNEIKNANVGSMMLLITPHRDTNFFGFGPDGNNMQILYNKFHDGAAGSGQSGTGPPTWYPIYISGYHQIIRGNEFYRFPSYGVHNNEQSYGHNDDIVIDQNYFHEFGQSNPSGTGYYSSGIVINTQDGTIGSRVTNNLFVNGDSAYALNVPQATHAVFANNTMHNMTGTAPPVGANAGGGIQILADTIVKNNIFSAVALPYLSPYSFISSINPTNWSDNYCTSSQPGCSQVGGTPFKNVSGGDFTIVAGNASIDHGVDVSNTVGCSTNTTWYPNGCRDLTGALTGGLGLVRPQGSAWDMGAYESPGVALVVNITGSNNPACTTPFTTCTVTMPTITFSGTTTASSGGSVTYATDRGDKGGAALVGSSWTTNAITLKAGINVIVITSTDSSGNSGSASIQVTYVPPFPGNTLVAAWGFEAGSGPTAIDSSTNKNTATLNGATWTTSNGIRNSGAINFSGSNQWLTVNDATSLDFTQSFTISAWVNPSVVSTNFNVLVTKNASVPTDTPPYRSFASIQGFCGSGGIAGFFLVNGSGTFAQQYSVCDPTPLAINRWTHVAVSYDGSNLRLYRDGALVPNGGGAIGTTPATGYIEPTTGTLYIGASQFGEYFQGTLDEIRLYNFAIPLSDSGKVNTSPNAACGSSDYTGGTIKQISLASVIGDMNCPVVALTAPTALRLKLGTTNGTLKLGTTNGTLKIGH